MATTQSVDAAAPPAPPAMKAEEPIVPTSSPPSPAPVAKKRRVERRERLRKSALCKHFGKPEGCPFGDKCKFAHGRSEVNDSDSHSVAAQRRLIREQAIHRTEEQFQTADAGAVTSKRRGTMIERYYTEMFSCDTNGKPMEDQYVHMHSNRLCVVGVAESHPVMQEEIMSVEFAQSVLDSRVTGKKKKGGQFMLPKTVLCVLKCKSGHEFTLYSCIRGALIEVNERLQTEPELLKQKNQSDGYLVIIQPKKVEVAEIQESLLSKDEYKQFRTISQSTAIKTGDPANDNPVELVPAEWVTESKSEPVPMEE
ncbi:protein fam206a-like [Phytophthora cinnamomi]|uniref:protein fam206a-like n=1 Tax=Phytophthora cinnamomi TaxID=4785 RepID=UPI00355A0BEC|nr:protein fam206a-like [Phytophthora cinnamomi]